MVPICLTLTLTTTSDGKTVILRICENYFTDNLVLTYPKDSSINVMG